EVDRSAILIKGELRPCSSKHDCCDRAARNAGDFLDLWKKAKFIETDKCPRMGDHRPAVSIEEPADRALSEHQAFLGQAAAQFLDREVRCCLKYGQGCLLMRLDAAGPAVSAQRLRSSVALLPFQIAPAAHACCANPK